MGSREQYGTFESIVYDPGGRRTESAPAGAPEYLRDLNLDQVIDAATAGKEEYDLKPLFYETLTSVETVRYRHEVVRDLRDVQLLAAVRSFADAMRLMRKNLAAAKKLRHRHQKERWFLHAAQAYCGAITDLSTALCGLNPSSRGFASLREYLTAYQRSGRFTKLFEGVRRLVDRLAAIRYCATIDGSAVHVGRCGDERDYSVEIAQTFAKFRRSDAKDYRVKFAAFADTNSVEERVLDFVALLFPAEFGELGTFVANHGEFADETVLRFDREVHFFVAYFDYIAQLENAGLPFCYPEVSAIDKAVRSEDGFDLALATKLMRANATVVCNDFSLDGDERIIVVSGPNQGGKTTFARTFGQLHHLASLGLPVPGRTARTFLFDRMFAHFEREESITNLRGKLHDDLVRFRAIFELATSRSIIVVNEIFNSTTLKDALFLAQRIVGRIADLDALCVCVTFLDELSVLNAKTVSMVSTVVPEDPAERTFRVVRRRADGRAYALAIAQKYGLTYDVLKRRLGA